MRSLILGLLSHKWKLVVDPIRMNELVRSLHPSKPFTRWGVIMENHEMSYYPQTQADRLPLPTRDDEMNWWTLCAQEMSETEELAPKFASKKWPVSF